MTSLLPLQKCFMIDLLSCSGSCTWDKRLISIFLARMLQVRFLKLKFSHDVYTDDHGMIGMIQLKFFKMGDFL